MVMKWVRRSNGLLLSLFPVHWRWQVRLWCYLTNCVWKWHWWWQSRQMKLWLLWQRSWELVAIRQVWLILVPDWFGSIWSTLNQCHRFFVIPENLMLAECHWKYSQQWDLFLRHPWSSCNGLFEIFAHWLTPL